MTRQYEHHADVTQAGDEAGFAAESPDGSGAAHQPLRRFASKAPLISGLPKVVLATALASTCISAALMSAPGCTSAGGGGAGSAASGARAAGSARESVSAEGGAEVISLLADDAGAVLAALRPWVEGADAGGAARAGTAIDIAPGQRATLEACGLRLVAIPVDQVGPVSAATLIGTQAASRASQLVGGVAAGWVEIAREGGDAEPRVVALHDSRVRLRPGYLRLLMRAWVEPQVEGATAPAAGAEAAAAQPDSGQAQRAETSSETGRGEEPQVPGTRFISVLRVELAFQHVESSGRLDPWARSLEAARTQRPRSIEEQGQVFSRLTTSIRLRAGQAVAITFAPPGLTWAELSEQAEREALAARTIPGAETPEGAPKLGEVRRDAGDDAAAQPMGAADPAAERPLAPLFRTPTLGEFLLARGSSADISGDNAATLVPSGRVVLFVVPRVGGEFSLLGR